MSEWTVQWTEKEASTGFSGWSRMTPTSHINIPGLSRVHWAHQIEDYTHFAWPDDRNHKLILAAQVILNK